MIEYIVSYTNTIVNKYPIITIIIIKIFICRQKKKKGIIIFILKFSVNYIYIYIFEKVIGAYLRAVRKNVSMKVHYIFIFLLECKNYELKI